MGFFWKSLEFDGEPIEVGQRPLRGLPAARAAFELYSSTNTKVKHYQSPELGIVLGIINP